MRTFLHSGVRLPDKIVGMMVILDLGSRRCGRGRHSNESISKYKEYFRK